jgi:hypothetical protein
MVQMSRMPLVVAALGLLFGCQTTSSSKPAKVERVAETSATVTAIDLPARLVTLQGSNGKLFTVEAGDQVRNLPQLQVGDRVVVSYYEALAAELAKPGQQATVSAEVTRAPLGAKPGAGMTQELTDTVRIDALDLPTHTVSFTDSGGHSQTITVRDPKMQDFLRTLKVGDKVAITYTEAVAIAVKPGSS